MIMKKVLLVLTLGAAALIMSSCFGRECVCKSTMKKDGEKVAKTKSIDFDEKCDKTGDWTDKETILGVEYETTTKCK